MIPAIQQAGQFALIGRHLDGFAEKVGIFGELPEYAQLAVIVGSLLRRHYSVDTIREWLKSIRNAPDEKAVHLLIARIEAVRTESKTDFNVESTLKPVLEKMGCGGTQHRIHQTTRARTGFSYFRELYC